MVRCGEHWSAGRCGWGFGTAGNSRRCNIVVVQRRTCPCLLHAASRRLPKAAPTAHGPCDMAMPTADGIVPRSNMLGLLCAILSRTCLQSSYRTRHCNGRTRHCALNTRHSCGLPTCLAKYASFRSV